MTRQNQTAVKLSSNIVSRVEERVKYTDFTDESEYIEYVLEEVLYHVEESEETAAESKSSEDEIQERLRSLGYID